MSETRNIVVVGGSSAGLSMAHYFLKHTQPKLKSSQPATKYKVHVIDPSSHFYWRYAAPRAIASTKLIKHEDAFTPIVDGFKQYDKDLFVFHHGTATAVDTASRTVTYKPFTTEASADAVSAPDATITYYALVIATGTQTPSPTTSLHGNYTKTRDALDDMNTRLAAATEVVIAGGGPIGVETAGEVGEQLNGAAGFRQSRPANPRAKVTLIAGADKLLPILRKSLSDKAETFLNRVGVDVLYGARVSHVELSAAEAAAEGVTPSPTADPQKTTIHLDNGTVLTADVYIPAMGAVPNTSFLPAALLDAKGYVRADAATLRVEDAGPRVYAVGDVGNYSRGGALNLYAAVPVASASLAADLASAPGKSEGKPFKAWTSESQIVPVGRSKGVGALKGYSMPSSSVWLIKGRDFMIGNRFQMTHGTKW